MSAVANFPSYSAILVAHLPRIIQTEGENEHYTAVLKELDARYETLNQAERDVADLLTLLIEDFESRHYELPNPRL